jgi:hypothetical protein
MRVARRFMPRIKTASEIATMHYLRTRTSVPVPDVYGYDADPYNRLGAEYIIMSKVERSSSHSSCCMTDLILRPPAFLCPKFIILFRTSNSTSSCQTLLICLYHYSATDSTRSVLYTSKATLQLPPHPYLRTPRHDLSPPQAPTLMAPKALRSVVLPLVPCQRRSPVLQRASRRRRLSLPSSSARLCLGHSSVATEANSPSLTRLTEARTLARTTIFLLVHSARSRA